jgi:hypothetical protein
MDGNNHSLDKKNLDKLKVGLKAGNVNDDGDYDSDDDDRCVYIDIYLHTYVYICLCGNICTYVCMFIRM